MWEVCLPACLFLLLTKFLEQAREVPVAVRGEQAGGPGLGGGEGKWGEGVRTREGGKIQTRSRRSKRHPHPNQTRDTHTPTLTRSHTLGQVPARRPPWRDTQTPSTNPANSQDTSWTHKEIQSCPAPTSHRNRVGSRQQQEGGEGNRRKDNRPQLGWGAKALPAGGITGYTSFSRLSKS